MKNSKEKSALQHIKNLLKAKIAPEIPLELTNNTLLVELHNELSGIRNIMHDLSQGNIANAISFKGYLAGCINALQAHLQHLSWQVEQVEKGDYSQRVNFMGEFSHYFNSLVIQMAENLDNLSKKEEELTSITNSLRAEVEQRSDAIEALQESEARFKYLANHDPLTGIFNRRSFMDVALKELEIAAMRNSHCCIALLDIDHFKNFNDTYGHLAGDAALKHMVKLAAGTLRHGDMIGRYGGEEFIFLFINTALDQGCKVADRIRNSINNNPLYGPEGPRPFTVSLGVCMSDPNQARYDEKYLREIINMADQALYKAKKLGRNRVIGATEEDIAASIIY